MGMPPAKNRAEGKSKGGRTEVPPLHKGRRTDLKIGHYGGKRFSEMAAEFAEAGEDDEFAGTGGDGFVFHVPGVLMRDVDGVEADTQGGIDVAARGIADHPAVGLDYF